MNSVLRWLGFPLPSDRDIIRFHFAKDLSYGSRILVSIFLLVLGFAIQLIFMNAWAGVPFLIPAVGLVLVRGYDSRIRLKTFSMDSNWTEVSIDKIQELEDLRLRTKTWDKDTWDISNPRGCFGLFLWVIIAFAVAAGLGLLVRSFTIFLVLIIDAAIIAIPQWFSGMRFILTQPNLAVRVALLLKLERKFHGMNRKGERFKPALMLTRGEDGKTVPVDARFSVVLPNSPEGFYGLQAQININLVQGRSYPYFYCVLAAKPGFDLQIYENRIRKIKNLMVEYQQDNRAEVLVLRQRTTKRSGYHTRDRTCVEILEAALKAGRMICGSVG